MVMSKLVVPCCYAQKTYLVHIVSDFHAHRAYSITHIYINVPFLTLCKWHLQAQLILIWIYCICGGCLYGGVTLNINCCVKQRVTFRVRSVGVWVFLSFSIPHTLYHSFYIPPLPPSLFLSLMGTGGEIPEGHRPAVAVVTDRHICTGMKGDCWDRLCGCKGQLSTWAGERKCSSDWGQPLVEAGKGSRQKGQSGLSLHLTSQNSRLWLWSWLCA